MIYDTDETKKEQKLAHDPYSFESDLSFVTYTTQYFLLRQVR
jgi:hypothetical protein